MGHPLKLAEARRASPPVSASVAEGLLAAAVEAIAEADVADIVRAQLAKAKAGDTVAAKFVLGFLGSAASKPKGPRVVQSPEGETAGKLRRRVARYLFKNGPTSEADLVELFGTEAADSTTLDCPWFARCNTGWHLTALGRKECG
jgi:hypothetical protein